MEMFISLAIVWYVLGFSSFVYWWTQDDNLTASILPLALMMGIAGPIAFIMGWSIHGKASSKDSAVLFKKRQ